jgi:hypothetical protein
VTAQPLTLGPLGHCAELRIDVTGGVQVVWNSAGGTGSLRLTVDPDAGEVRLQGDGAALSMPCGSRPERRIRLLLDADIAELTVAGAGGIGAARCDVDPRATVTVHGIQPGAASVRVSAFDDR